MDDTEFLEKIRHELNNGYIMVIGQNRDLIRKFMIEVYPPPTKCNDVRIIENNNALLILVKKTEYLLDWLKSLGSRGMSDDFETFYNSDDKDKLEGDLQKFNILEFRSEGITMGSMNDRSKLYIHKRAEMPTETHIDTANLN